MFLTLKDIINEYKIQNSALSNVSTNNEKLKNINANIDEVKNNLDHLTDYAIKYFDYLKKEYGSERKRKTKVQEFDDLDKKDISIKNKKL